MQLELHFGRCKSSHEMFAILRHPASAVTLREVSSGTRSAWRTKPTSAGLSSASRNLRNSIQWPLTPSLQLFSPLHSYNISMPKQSGNQSEPLLIDRAAAAELPSNAAVSEWAREKRAFISSVMADLAEERQAVAAAVRSVGVRAVLFEEFGGRDADPEEAYLAEVEGADIYIGILGRRYGKPLKSRFSATHAEYLHAEKHALRMAVWTAAAADRETTNWCRPICAWPRAITRWMSHRPIAIR